MRKTCEIKRAQAKQKIPQKRHFPTKYLKKWGEVIINLFNWYEHSQAERITNKNIACHINSDLIIFYIMMKSALGIQAIKKKTQIMATLAVIF